MATMFDGWSIGPMKMRNRIVRAATAESLCTKEGAPSKRMNDLYRCYVRGGVGLIITGYCFVCPDGKASERSVSLCDDEVMPALRQLVETVHAPEEEEPAQPVKVPSLEALRSGAAKAPKVPPREKAVSSGVPIVAQLVYGGSKSKLAADDPRWIAVEQDGEEGAVGGKVADGKSESTECEALVNVDIVGPSAVRHPSTGLVPREATLEDIARITDSFAAAADRAKQLGFDGVEIHAAHGYLLSQFLDGRFNKRGDAYGGSLEGRARFALEVVAAVRGRVGGDFPILVKLNSCDMLSDPMGAQGGLSEEESLKVAQWLVEAGASCIEVSGDWHAVEAEDVKGEPFFGAFGTRLARRIDAPVIVTGGWRDPEIIDRYLETTDIAGIGMGRPLISQPFLPEIWSSGIIHAAECRSCNFCTKHNGIPCILRKGK